MTNRRAFAIPCVAFVFGAMVMHIVHMSQIHDLELELAVRRTAAAAQREAPIQRIPSAPEFVPVSTMPVAIAVEPSDPPTTEHASTQSLAATDTTVLMPSASEVARLGNQPSSCCGLALRSLPGVNITLGWPDMSQSQVDPPGTIDREAIGATLLFKPDDYSVEDAIQKFAMPSLDALMPTPLCTPTGTDCDNTPLISSWVMTTHDDTKQKHMSAVDALTGGDRDPLFGWKLSDRPLVTLDMPDCSLGDKPECSVRSIHGRLKRTLGEFDNPYSLSLAFAQVWDWSTQRLYLPELDALLSRVASGEDHVYLVINPQRGSPKMAVANARMLDRLGIKNYIIAATDVTHTNYFKSLGINAICPFDLYMAWPICFRDDSSAIEIALTLEILKRGYSVINIDVDVILFRKWKREHLDADFAVSSYAPYRTDDPNAAFNHVTSFLCFGLWTCRATPTGIRLWTSFMLKAALSVKPGPNGGWICDDQDIFHRWIQERQDRVSTFFSGPNSINRRDAGNDNSTFSMRALVNEFITPGDVFHFRVDPDTWKDNTVAIHMTTLGDHDVKSMAMHEIMINFGEDPEYWEVPTLIMSYDHHGYKSNQQNLESGFVTLAAVAKHCGRAFVVPRLACDQTTHRIGGNDKWCYYFQRYSVNRLQHYTNGLYRASTFPDHPLVTALNRQNIDVCVGDHHACETGSTPWLQYGPEGLTLSALDSFCDRFAAEPQITVVNAVARPESSELDLDDQLANFGHSPHGCC